MNLALDQWREYRDSLGFIQQRHQARECGQYAVGDRADPHALHDRTLTRRRQATLGDQLGEHAQVQLERQPQARLLGAGRQHLGIGRNVQRRHQEPGSVVGVALATDPQLLLALGHQHDARLNHAHHRRSGLLTPIKAQAGDRHGVVAGRRRARTNRLDQRVQGGGSGRHGRPFQCFIALYPRKPRASLPGA